MDPFTALGLASNVIQIIDFSCRLVSKGQKIYKSADGTSMENVDTEAAANDLEILNTKLQRSFDTSDYNSQSMSDEDRSLIDLCQKCSRLAIELQTKLNGLKVTGKHRKWKSARQALKSVSGKDGIEELANSLSVYRDEINLNITISLRGRLDLMSTQQSRRFDDLDSYSKALMEALNSRTTDIMNALPTIPKRASEVDPIRDLHEASLTGDRARLRALLAVKDQDVNARDANGQTALHLASLGGHSLLIQTLLNNKAQLEAENYLGQTALHLAAMSGQWAALRTLLLSGANKDAEDDDRQSPLSYSRLRQSSNHELCTWMLVYGHGLESRDDHGDNLLLFAAAQGLETLVQYLLDKRADVEVLGGAGAPPLVLAAAQGRHRVIQLLLDRGARIEAIDANGSTALISAVWKGHLEAVRVLLDRGANVQVKNLEDHTPLDIASGFQDRGDIIQLLVSKGAKPSSHCLLRACNAGIINSIASLLKAGIDIEWSGQDGETALMVAARRGRPGTVEVLIQQGANVDARHSNGRTALSIAVVEGHLKVIETLLNNGADIESRANNSDTAVMLAAFHAKPAALRILLKHGADIEARRQSDGATALWIAAEAKNIVEVQELLKHGANIECQGGRWKYTPLCKATLHGNIALVQILLDAGADVQAANSGGVTALHEAAKHHRTRIADLLVSRGADLESMDIGSNMEDFRLHGCHGFTPLLYAVSQNNQIPTRYLLEKGARLENKSGVDQRTALSEACYRGHKDVVLILLHQGADVETRDREGRTPLMHAARLGHQDVVKWLLRYGAYRGARDPKGATAITLAAKEKRTEIVNSLR